MRNSWQIIGCMLIFLVLGLLSTAALGTALLKHPFLVAPIRSNSMYPLMERGDAVLICPIDTSQVAIHDIIVFRPEGGSLGSLGWAMHRVVGGNVNEGFVTKGDANEYTDQEGNTNPVQTDSIVARAITLAGQPLRIKLLGYPSLWLEQYNKSPYALPGCMGTIALLLITTELRPKKRRKKRAKSTPAYIMYPAVGLAVCLLLGAAQIAASSFITFNYEVSPSGRGFIMGNTVGMVQQGDVITKELSEVKGNVFLPMVIAVTSNDLQFSFNKDLFLTKPGTEEKLNITVKADQPGKYESKISIGVFLPTLPPLLTQKLAQVSYWLALWATSLIPALPLLLWPVVDPRLRRLMARSARKNFSQMTRKLPL